MLERVFDPYHFGLRPLRPNTHPGAPEVQKHIVPPPPHDPSGGDRLTVIFAKETSALIAELGCVPADVRDAAMDEAVSRVQERRPGSDNSEIKSDPTGGVYVDCGNTVLPQSTPTAALPRGSQPIKSLAVDASLQYLQARSQLLHLARSPSARPLEPLIQEELSAYEMARLKQIADNADFLRASCVRPTELH